MRLTIPTASKTYTCNQCTEPIHKGEMYLSIKIAAGGDFVSGRALQTSNYITIRLHLECLAKWARTRPRRKFNYKGRKPLSIKQWVKTPKGPFAYDLMEIPLAPEQRKRRAVLIATYHRHSDSCDLHGILVEMDSLGGIPKHWLS